jgi:hypothetical protein
LTDTDESSNTNPPIQAPRSNRWTRLVSYIKSKTQERKAKKQNETSADRAARRTAVATIWMAIFTLVLAATSGFTIWILKNQLREMHEGGIDTHALAEATGDMATAASDQADAAQQFSDTAEDINSRMSDAVDQLQVAAENAKASIRATQNAMRLEQRAWLGASDYTYSIAVTDPVGSVAMVLNTGRTPAMDILCKITGTTKMKSDILRDSDIVYPAELPILKQGTLFPNQHFPLKAGGPPMDQGKQKIWFENVHGGEWVQYFFGEVQYKDVFRMEHWTHFCTQFVPATKSGTPCPIYNDTDDDKDQKAN